MDACQRPSANPFLFPKERNIPCHLDPHSLARDVGHGNCLYSLFNFRGDFGLWSRNPCQIAHVGRVIDEASTGLHPWYPSFLRRNPPKHPPSLFELRPSPTVVGYGRRRSEGPTVAFIYGLAPMVFCEGGYIDYSRGSREMQVDLLTVNLVNFEMGLFFVGILLGSWSFNMLMLPLLYGLP